LPGDLAARRGAGRGRPERGLEAVMKISARNSLTGTVTSIERGAVNAKVKVDLGGGNVVTSLVTLEAVDELGVAEGGRVSVVIKASDVMLATE
jgi:molybdopterin-binding protein